MDGWKIIAGIWSIALAFRCLYLEYRIDRDAKSIEELTDLLNRTNVALANELAKNLIPADYPKPVSGCNDPERMCG